MLLEGQTAIVTGAGRGIGRATAIYLAEHGARVVVNDPGVTGSGDPSSDRPAERVAEEIEDRGGVAIPNLASVADEEGARSIVGDAIDAFGSLEILVNCAGILRDRILHRMSTDEWDAVVAVHLRGTFLTCRSALQHMREQMYGRIINFVSTSGLIGNVGQGNYGAAKLGIHALTRTIAIENASKNVTANAVTPWAWTRMTESIPDSGDAADERLERLKQLSPQDVAPLVAYLGSPGATDVSGQIFGVRGREVMVFSQPRPLRSVHNSEGWDPQSVGEVVEGALASSFTPLETSAGVFSYGPLL